MELNVATLMRILQVFILLDLLLLAALLLSKQYYRRRHRRKRKISGIIGENLLTSRNPVELQKLLRRSPRFLFAILKELGDSVQLPADLRDRWLKLLRRGGYGKRIRRQLHSPLVLRRLQAATALGIIGGKEAGEGLLKRLSSEPRWFIRLILIQLLARHEYTPALPEIFRTLKNAPKWVRQKSFAVLPNFGEALEQHIEEVLKEPAQRDMELLFELGELYSCEALNSFLVENLRGSHSTAARRAAAALAQSKPILLQSPEFYHHRDESIRTTAVHSLRWRPSREYLEVLVAALTDSSPSVRREAVSSLEEIVTAQPQYIEHVVERFHAAKDPLRRGNLARVLESRIEYFLTRMNTGKHRTAKAIIEELSRLRRLSVVFGFLERNREQEAETTLLEILRPITARDPEVREIATRYLPERLLDSLDLQKEEFAAAGETVPLKRADRRLLIVVLAAVLLSGPVVYVIQSWGEANGAGDVLAQLIGFSQLFNYLFVFYSLAINSIYLILLIFAVLHLYRQHRYWNISSFNLLFTRDLLPSISVLAPAYNEEINIVDNVKSLVNLHYPEVEVIIINDGSRDKTLERLLQNFEMERVDREGSARIATEPVRGIYISRSFPNLTVIDKVNGGKADSLNAGINLATKDFICTIDSDSILESDALLKAAFHTVLSDKEPVALGGNIIPANGCTVRNGRPVEIALPKEHLGRFQTIEYMRAFLAGRLGWSLINSMVIISGAFGLFIRKRVVEVGGYLTPKSRHGASTVGEDMELVVRLHEHMRRQGIPYKVFDAFNANCWTEVPDSFTVLHRQRDRWHRGLIESIVLHKNLAFNPHYGPVGSIAFPYFIIFELLGPFLEMFGYLNFFFSLAFGLITGPVALLLFISVILYGILVSLGSLLISENEILYFSIPETIKIIFYAVLENFGFRQVMSAIRVTAYVSFIFKEKSWGVMERKGFVGQGQ